MSTPYYVDDAVTLHHGDCLDVLRQLPDASVDSVVTDPPYGLANTSPEQVADTIVRWVNGDRDYLPGGSGFMGKAWDAFVPPVAVWDECLRVLKPGGHVLAFAGSRTHDLMTLALRLAGFDIRDSIAWLYGSGFPKSLDVSKAIDKRREEDRAPVDAVRSWLNERRVGAGFSHDAVNKHFGHASNGGGSSSAWMTNPTSRSLPTWDQWQELKSLFGFGDDMDAEVWRLNGRKGKPGDNFEAREVLSERVSVVEGGSGGWSDMVASGRFKPGEKIIRETAPATPDAERWQGWGTALKPAFEPVVVARKPLAGTVASNVLQHGTGALNIAATRVGSGADKGIWPKTDRPTARNSMAGPMGHDAVTDRTVGRWPTNVVLDDTQAAELDEQSGERPGAVSNGSKTAEGMNGTDTFKIRARPQVPGYGDTGGASRFFPTFRYEAKAPTSERPRVDGVAHPTVKPLDLMRWLVRLVTPPGGTVLEPFAGSGTTAEACVIEGFQCIAIEREATYLPLIVARLTKPIEMALDLGDSA